ncbi:uncharacterized protein [Montipora foliosa]|uniref:uncharacterized protein n=1 Tax=Montipora foliosa TaxID=591990 RepID=UPI0035F1AB29
MDVVGCSLNLQMMKDQAPILRKPGTSEYSRQDGCRWLFPQFANDERPSTDCPIILARGHSCAEVSFHPYTEKPSDEQCGCTGYVAAYMNLDDQGLKIPGRVHRLRGVELRPFRVDMTAKIDPSLHNIEYECVVIVSGHLQEEEQRLVMRGRGSYDQTHEGLVNVTTDT